MNKGTQELKALIAVIDRNTADLSNDLDVSEEYLKNLLKPSKEVPPRMLAKIKRLAIQQGRYDPDEDKYIVPKRLSIPKKVFIIRNALGASRKDFASRIENASEQIVRNWETGTTKLSAETFEEIVNLANKHSIIIE